MTKYKKIGILGGMGPEATADFYLRIIRLFQNKLGATYNSDFPEIIIDSIPLPPYNVVDSDIDDGTILEFLINGCLKLQKAGADVITIPCNTAHKYLEELRTAVDIPILSIMEEVILELKKQNIQTALILATSKTVLNKLYENKLNKFKINFVNVTPQEQEQITAVIINVISNKNNDNDKKILLKIIENYSKSVDSVILGCTELPLATGKLNLEIPIFDTLQILALATFNYTTQRS